MASEKRCSLCCKQIWKELEDIVQGTTGDVLYDSLFEEEFMARVKRRQMAEERQRLAQLAAKKASKVKKVKVVEKKVTNSSMACVHSSKASSGYNSFSYPDTTSSTSSLKSDTISNERLFVKEVPKMEADSQSQDEIIVISEDEEEFNQPIKVELDEMKFIGDKPELSKLEEQETNRWDLQTPVLRAVVRPENIEQLSINENLKEECIQNVQGTKSESLLAECEETQEVESMLTKEGNQVNSRVEGGGEVVVDLAQEVVAVEPVATPSTKGDHSSPLYDAKTNGDLLLEEITKVSDVPEGIPPIWPDIDGQNFQNQPFGDIFDPNDPSMFMYYPEGTGENQNWPFSHDLILTQYDDELFAQYECGNTNAFPDFYNEQPDMLFTGMDMSSPPLMEMMRDEPVEYQLSTTHWEDLSMMVSESTCNEKTDTTNPDSAPAAPDEEEAGPTVVFIERRKGRRAKPKSKTKETNSTKKETEQINEKKTKAKEGMFFYIFFKFLY
ncbi:hypothetical protein J6590_062243 [Homalodisca vitripennis]|nr:hypothetical protein J6590_062243 [Homalodisca vitripennis]